ncbi:response regulator [Pseudonocardia phyllosphaerae]|uniref:response regulator n=1 Tax=Pseudonocardia phyllosphaerae TaxID=3390502 RepID=UPI00397A16CC
MTGSGAGRPAVRVLVVDDHEFLRRGLGLVCETFAGIELVGEADDGREALALIPAVRPDVVITDARMPGMDGLALVQAMGDAHPDLPALVLTTFEDADLVGSLIQAGASGYLLKDVGPERLEEAVHAVAAGGLVLDPRIARHLRRPDRPDDSLAVLTGTERRVGALVAEGATNTEIAEALHLAEGTVKNHVSALLRKVGARDRTNLALTLAKAMGG